MNRTCVGSLKALLERQIIEVSVSYLLKSLFWPEMFPRLFRNGTQVISNSDKSVAEKGDCELILIRIPSLASSVPGVSHGVNFLLECFFFLEDAQERCTVLRHSGIKLNACVSVFT